MKLSKTKKILLLGTGLVVLTTSIVTPIVILNKDENNKDENNKENDVEKLFKILKAKTTKEKIIELPSDASGKIIADNQEKIIEKIKALIGQSNLKGVKIEVSMQSDTNISTSSQKITIKLTKNKVLKEIKDFSVKKQSIVESLDEDIAAIRDILDAKTNHDLIITLPRNSTGNIIGKTSNKNEIIKKLRILIDPSNTSGEANHPSLRGTLIDISMSVDAPISIDFQDIIVSISKTGGTTLRTTKIFKVKKESTTNEDIAAIKKIINAIENNNKTIIIPNSSSGSIINNLINKNTIERKIRILIDPLNISGDPNHWSLRGTTITLISVAARNDLISIRGKVIVIEISKLGGKSSFISSFDVKKSRV